MIRCEELAINLGKSSLAEPRRRKEISVMESNHTYMMGPKSHGMSGNIAFQARGDASKNHDYRAAALKAGGGKTGTNTREGNQSVKRGHAGLTKSRDCLMGAILPQGKAKVRLE
jgi:hypothetical protein